MTEKEQQLLSQLTDLKEEMEQLKELHHKHQQDQNLGKLMPSNSNRDAVSCSADNRQQQRTCSYRRKRNRRRKSNLQQSGLEGYPHTGSCLNRGSPKCTFPCPFLNPVQLRMEDFARPSNLFRLQEMTIVAPEELVRLTRCRKLPNLSKVK